MPKKITAKGAIMILEQLSEGVIITHSDNKMSETIKITKPKPIVEPPGGGPMKDKYVTKEHFDNYARETREDTLKYRKETKEQFDKYVRETREDTLKYRKETKKDFDEFKAIVLEFIKEQRAFNKNIVEKNNLKT